MSAAEVYGSVSVKSECPYCLEKGRKRIILRHGKMAHWFPMTEVQTYPPCLDYDSECRHAAEPLGFYTFAWKPRRCRNRRLRWLTWVERHDDGTFTLGNRAF